MSQSEIEKSTVMTAEKRKTAYQNDGFVLVRQFLPQDEMDELNIPLEFSSIF